jgi:hypothetical protein
VSDAGAGFSGIKMVETEQAEKKRKCNGYTFLSEGGKLGNRNQGGIAFIAERAVFGFFNAIFAEMLVTFGAA